MIVREICRLFIRFDAQDYAALPAIQAKIEAIKAARVEERTKFERDSFR